MDIEAVVELMGDDLKEMDRIQPTPPRYDDVFYDGLEWLDSLAGREITDTNINNTEDD